MAIKVALATKAILMPGTCLYNIELCKLLAPREIAGQAKKVAQIKTMGRSSNIAGQKHSKVSHMSLLILGGV
jgi:hypothetical protein